MSAAVDTAYAGNAVVREWRYEGALAATTFTGLLTVLLFVCVNPFLALFVLAVTSFYLPVPKWIFIVMGSLAFAVFFFNREYGMDWYPGISGDDVPHYVGLYVENYGL